MLNWSFENVQSKSISSTHCYVDLILFLDVHSVLTTQVNLVVSDRSDGESVHPSNDENDRKCCSIF